MAFTKTNSTIKIKCKCSPKCDKLPTLSCMGYYYAHVPEHLKEKVGTRKQVAIKNRNKRVALSRKLHIEQRKVDGEENAKKELWFLGKRPLMTGKCECGCGNPTSKHQEKYWRFSVCHVLAKHLFKSIRWHPDNWIELAFFGGCHTTLDDMGYEYCKEKKPILWEKIVAKFKILYPYIDSSEWKYIPNVLLETLKQ